MAEFEVVVLRTVIEEMVYRHVEADSPEEAESICLEMAEDDDGWKKKEILEDRYSVVFCDGDF